MRTQRTLIIAIYTTLLSASLNVSAGFQSGNELYEMCTSRKEDTAHELKDIQCLGYVTGVFDYMVRTYKPNEICVDGRIIPIQLVKIFTAYSDKNPDMLHKPADLVVENSIKAAFKCAQ